MIFLQAHAAGGSYAGALVQSLLALVAVCALAVIALRLLARTRGVGPAARGERLVRVVERTPLDTKRALVVVDAGAERLLLGVGEEGAPTLLRVLPRSTWNDEPVASEPRRGAPGGFAAAVSALRPTSEASRATERAPAVEARPPRARD